MQRSFLRTITLESLESRRLLKGGPHNVPDSAIELNAGVLTIVGTSKGDRISVSSDGTTLTVSFNNHTETFATADVTSISIDGGKGNDQIEVGAEVTAAATITGGDGNDRITGGGGNDTIDGGAKNDRVIGGAGNDILTAGQGNDWMWGGEGDDSLDAGAGNDRLFGEAGRDELLAGAGNDALDGGADNDILHGGDGHDRARGGAGDDQVFGEGNKDLLYGDEGHDFLDGGDDKDHLLGGDGDDILAGGAGNDQLNGGAGNNLLDGGPGTDKEINGTPIDLTTQLAAALTSATIATASGTATFGFTLADGVPEFELNVSVSGYTPSATLDVSVNGTVVGQITTDASGNGTFVASTSPGAGEVLLPDGLSITAGTVVLVSTDLSGTLALV